METTESRLGNLDQRQRELKATIKQVEEEIAARLDALG